MTIIDALRENCTGLNNEVDNIINTNLYSLAAKIANDASEHLKLVITQLPEFDLHDESHSKKILNNIELLLETSGSISKLSKYELFLIYVSAYLHDCAMALPQWELDILMLTEGTNDYVSERIKKPIANDLLPPFKVSEALRIIDERKEDLYYNFDKIKEFIFIQHSEEDLKRDLAERLISYQEFRNGYINELNEIIQKNDKALYLEFSEMLRYEFVRSTHAHRIEKYILSLTGLFCEKLNGSWGTAIVRDLALICRSHGENFDYIKELETKTSYFGDESANIQFIAIMLRIGDILHFSYDRAPKSLFAEIMIKSKESIKHWKAKFQGVNYSISDVDHNGRTKIKYIAYCDDPDSYYFLQEYLDWIDDEINNYFKFIHAMDLSINTKDNSNKYFLKIAEQTDRTQVKYNRNKFIPAKINGFSLAKKKL